MSKVIKLFLLLGFSVVALHPKGTLAGTEVSNSAYAYYTVGNIDYNLTTNTDTFLVDRVIDVGVSWQDSAAIEVGAGENAAVLTFLVTNLGNGDDIIGLSYEHNTSSSDYAPNNAIIYIDSNSNGIYDAGTDLQANDINLSADTNATLFIVADTPDANQSIGDSSYDGIKVDSQSTATQGSDTQNDVDTVVRTGSGLAVGEYIMRDYWLSSQKYATVHSDDNQTHTGTVISYKIDLYIGGHSDGRTIDAVLLRDDIPAGTSYVPGSLKLGGSTLSDAVDVDAGLFDGTATEVNVGTISGATHKEVTFDVQVQ